MRHLMKAVAEGTSLDEALPKEFHIKLHRLKSNWKKWLHETLARVPG